MGGENSVLLNPSGLNAYLMNDDYSIEPTQGTKLSLMFTIEGILKLSTKLKSQVELRT